MNKAHLHLIFNHLPIILPMVGLLLMLGGFIVRAAILKRAAYCIFILAALCALIAFATGDGAEDAIKHLPGVARQDIKTHEQVALIFSLGSYLLGALSLWGLWADKKKTSYTKTLSILAIGLSFLVLFYAIQTGTTGGEIRHPEIKRIP